VATAASPPPPALAITLALTLATTLAAAAQRVTKPTVLHRLHTTPKTARTRRNAQPVAVANTRQDKGNERKHGEDDIGKASVGVSKWIWDHAPRD